MDDSLFVTLLNGVLQSEAAPAKTPAAKTVWSRIENFYRLPYARGLSAGIATASYAEPHPFFTVLQYGADGEGEVPVYLCRTPAEFWDYVLQV